MIDSMPWHAQAWVGCIPGHGHRRARPHGTHHGPGGFRCIVELLGRPVSQDEADALTHEETIYRELFAPRFSESGRVRPVAAQVRAHWPQGGRGHGG